ncbi:MAG: glycosyltransferase [Bacteroidota bacterium]|nr:glycosyltransferase [Bacteroidota bacterium]
MKFSIILPVRNGGHYVKDCVASILSQSLQDFNLIVLDNRSVDGTLEWLHSLNDSRIIIYESNSSLSIEENWSRINDVPKSEFITLIGHDDLLNEDYLETMNGLIEKHPLASLYQAHFQYIDKNGSLLRDCLPMDEIQYAHEYLACFMCRTIDSTGTGYMMRSKDYDNLHGIDPSFRKLLFADYALWLDMTLLSYKATSPQLTFKYRSHKSVSRITGTQKFVNAFEHFLIFIKEHAEKNSQIKMITERYGNVMLLFYCESLSHRLLKTPLKEREMLVSDFIEICNKYAALLSPGNSFEPEKKFRIKIAKRLDSTDMGRTLFRILNKIIK